jgi:hypothetical protein
MRIGIDFDNTIVCYDELFHKVARERNLIPADLPINKSEVRNYLRRAGQEAIWTEMQGAVYGGRMAEATPYPGVIAFFKACRSAGIEVRIISHKTRYPFLGEQHDLHKAARNWLELQGFFDSAGIGLAREHAFFELTKQEKLQRIVECKCTHFIDDLPEILAEPSFPEGVEKILFDSADIYQKEVFTRLTSWKDILRHFSVSAPDERENSFRVKVALFLAHNGIASDFQIELLRGGGNNRVYRICDAAKSVTLKEYFQNPNDPRDRFATEKSFYNFIFDHGVPGTAERIGWDLENRVGLFSFIIGRKLEPKEVNGTFVQQAAAFIVQLNHHKNGAAAQEIRPASEACFSIAEHVACVDRRIERLQSIECNTELDQEAATFVRTELTSRWKKVRTEIAKTAGVEFDSILPQQHRCLSPSDFGFHNALLSVDGQLRFFDFEYAGWDDPAKLVCDFFSQPQIPVGLEFWSTLVQALRPNADVSFVKRADLLLPAYQIKWCCIILNEFLRGDQARRDFAVGAADLLNRKTLQLEKAKAALARVNKTGDC